MIYMLLMLFTVLSAEIQIETYKGKEIGQKIEPTIQFINQIYRDPPFLYNGNDAEYRAYLMEYAHNDESYLNLIMNNDKIVGVALGIPLSHSRELYKQPFKDVKGIYYIGEFGLNPSYRNKGYEDQLIKKLESEAKAKGYRTLAIWELEKTPSANSPLLPFAFWEKQGFKRHPEFSFNINWTNLGDTKESNHEATYWLKPL